MVNQNDEFKFNDTLYRVRRVVGEAVYASKVNPDGKCRRGKPNKFNATTVLELRTHEAVVETQLELPVAV